MYAPIVLFAYKRPTHLAKTLAALQANTLAPHSDLIIFSDGPKSDADVEAVERCRRLASSIHGFSSVRLEVQPTNQGLARSVISGVTNIMKTHGRAIVLEDDILTTPQFLSYMNSALNWYQSDPKAFSITGYTYPGARLHIPDDYAFDTYPAYRSSSWGWACWGDRWARIDWTMDYYERFMADKVAQAAFNRGGDDLVPMLRLQKQGRIDSWAIRFAYAHYAFGSRCIHPVRTLVSNIGLDNSGTHTGESPMHMHAEVEKDWLPIRFCPGDILDPRIAAAFHAAASPPRVGLPWRILRKVLRIAGLKRT